MVFDPYLAQRLAGKYMKDRLREAEQERMVRAAQGSRRTLELWSLAVLIVGALLGSIVLQF